MSAVWLKLIAILCLSCTALSGPGASRVVWRDLGGSVTIQCRISQTDQEFLILKKGLNKELEVLYKADNSEKNTIDNEFKGRLQLNGIFPNMDILIKNLTSDDTGPYWCVYKKFDQSSTQQITMEGIGHVLLVVKEAGQQCDPQNHKLILTSVGICAAVLVCIILCFLIWIICKTKMRTTKKPRHIATNDVYEDMRGTIRR